MLYVWIGEWVWGGVWSVDLVWLIACEWRGAVRWLNVAGYGEGDAGGVCGVLLVVRVVWMW